MATPFAHVAGDENALPTVQPKDANALAKPNTTSSARSALGEVSPNVRMNASVVGSSVPGRRPLAGSPLKRSFTAAIESGSGLTYLKKRKLSMNSPLSETGQTSTVRGTTLERRTQVHNGSRPIEHADEATQFKRASEEQVQGSPTEPNTPSDSEETITQPSSGDRKSFSSLINYDPSSQSNNPHFGAEQQHRHKTSPSTAEIVVEPVSKAELLRLNLRVAMFKVSTNQIDVPFPKLKIQGERAWVNTASTSPPLTTEAVEAAVAALRREAQVEMNKQQDLRQQTNKQQQEQRTVLMPGFVPVLKPTAYSSRTISHPSIQEHEFSSSPPTAFPNGSNASTPRLPVAEHVSNIRSGSPRIAHDVSLPDPWGTEMLPETSATGTVAKGLPGLQNCA